MILCLGLPVASDVLLCRKFDAIASAMILISDDSVSFFFAVPLS